MFVPAKAGTHAEGIEFYAIDVDAFSRQLTLVVIGPRVRGDDG
jgi:hypothetical protein